MAADHFLGIDIGTYESKGVITDAAGRVLAEAAHPHRMLVPQPGWAEHRPDADWWGDFVFLARALLDQSGLAPGRIAAIAVSAIGPCMLPVDADGRPLMNGILYGVDTRAAEEIGLLNDSLGRDAIFALGANDLSSQSVGPKILWLRRQRPELFDRTATILTSTSYIVLRLTGERVIDRHTAAHFSPLYDIAATDWTEALTDGIVGRDRLPRLGWTTEIAGHVTAEAAAETGLAQGTPVTFGTIDAAAEAVSVGVHDAGQLMMMYGSSIFTIAVTDRLLGIPGLFAAPWLFAGQHASMAGVPTSGTLTHWLRDQMARELPRETAFATLTAEAAQSEPGARGLILLPYFSGAGTPVSDPAACGMLFGLNLTHGRGDIMRATLEGIAMATRQILETWRAAGLPVAEARAVGGGTKNAVWLQATSDYGGLRQQVCTRTTGAAYGDAFLAAVAVGAAERGDITRWNAVARTVEPVGRPMQEARYRQFRALYEATRAIAHEL